jgi:Uma2 family endonuclease
VPRPEDVLLLIEVADTTLAYDRKTKLKLYAQAGIAEAWIVDIQARCVEVYREPQGNGYARKSAMRPGDVVTPLALPMVRVPVVDLFA